MHKIIPISELQRQSRQIVGSLADDDEPVIITHRGRAEAVLVSAERFARIESDLARLDEFELEAMLQRTEAEIAAGNTISQETVKERLNARKESGRTNCDGLGLELFGIVKENRNAASGSMDG